MLRPIFDLPPGVIGYSAVGKITADDYAKVLIPELEAKIKGRRQAALPLSARA